MRKTHKKALDALRAALDIQGREQLVHSVELNPRGRCQTASRAFRHHIAQNYLQGVSVIQEQCGGDARRH